MVWAAQMKIGLTPYEAARVYEQPAKVLQESLTQFHVR